MFCYILFLCTETITSWVQVHISGNYPRIIYSVPKSFDCFPSDTNFAQAGKGPPVE